MLEAMLGGQFAIERDSHGHIFLDRDPKHFRRILNFLRTDKVVIPETREGQLEFLLEAQYYGVQEIEDSVRFRIVPVALSSFFLFQAAALFFSLIHPVLRTQSIEVSFFNDLGREIR
jgi:hypothetical protein